MAVLELSGPDRTQLEALRATDGRASERAAMVLLAARGWSDTAIATELGTSRQRVGRWRRRWDSSGVTTDAVRPGRPLVDDLVALRPLSGPPPSERGWTAVAVGTAAGVSPATVRRIWRTWGVVGGRAPRSAACVLPSEVAGFAGLHLDPPDLAFAYWVDSARPDSSHRPGAAPIDGAILTMLAAVPGADRCFPRLGGAQFDEFLQRVHGSRDRPEAVLHVVVGHQDMLDDDVAQEWRDAPGVLIGGPHPGTTWLDHLSAVAEACHRADEPVSGASLRDAVATTLDASVDHDCFSWISAGM